MAMLKTFRILMANQPKLMRELLVEMLAEESWIEIVGEVTHEVEIRAYAKLSLREWMRDFLGSLRETTQVRIECVRRHLSESTLHTRKTLGNNS
jgi:hypothetical protein